jgi:hypothetical protein
MRRTHTPMLSILEGRLHHMTNSSQHMITTINIIIPELQNTAWFFQKNRTLLMVPFLFFLHNLFYYTFQQTFQKSVSKELYL